MLGLNVLGLFFLAERFLEFDCFFIFGGIQWQRNAGSPGQNGSFRAANVTRCKVHTMVELLQGHLNLLTLPAMQQCAKHCHQHCQLNFWGQKQGCLNISAMLLGHTSYAARHKASNADGCMTLNCLHHRKTVTNAAD